MKIGIMQPYFLPYIGYFQLINAVDKFVIYDDVQYIKRGWINRNRILVNAQDSMVTLSLKKDSKELKINQRYFIDDTESEFNKIVKGIELAYKKAPFINEGIEIAKKIFEYNKKADISKFITNSLQIICNYLNIKTEFIISSNLNKDNSLKGQDKVINIVKLLKGSTYINSYGGIELYGKDAFANNGIELLFIKSKFIKYTQFKNEFISNLSILDVIMFNSKDTIKEYLNQFELF